MSNRALNWAFDSGLPPGQRFVLVCLGDAGTDHSGEDWTCFPSVLRLMEMTGFGRSTVERHLTWLWLEGWISRKARVRPDGTLGINDYILHRHAERRAELKAERAGIKREPGRRPSLKSKDGPSLKSAVSIPQIGGQQTLDLRGQEPPTYPSTEPSLRAREPGSEGIEAFEGFWPSSGLKRTKWPQARAAFARQAQVFGVEALIAAGRACAADPELAGGDYGWPGLQQWLSEERFRFWLQREPATPAAAPTAGWGFAGPSILRFEIVAAEGEGFAAAYLDRAHWDLATSTITPATRTAFVRLSERVAHVLHKHGATLAPPGGAHERHD